MFSLLRADFLKTRKRAMGWSMLAISAVMVVLVLVLSRLDSSPEAPQLSFAFPSGLLLGAQVLSQLGGLMMIIFGATLVGSEYGFDTWKNLLTRRPGRAMFLASKWITLALALLIATIALPLWAQALGSLFGPLLGADASGAPLPLSAALLQVGMSAIAPLVAGTIGMLGAVIGRSSVGGIVAGIAWLIADSVLAQFLPAPLAILSFAVAQSSLGANLAGAPAPFGLPASLLAVALYLAVPLGLAIGLFRRRDMI
jgi:ABC-type transport system involved in multi-copper enzyme maturation permease subunit